MKNLFDPNAYRDTIPPKKLKRLEFLIDIIEDSKETDGKLHHFEELLDLSKSFNIIKITIEMLLAIGMHYHHKGLDYGKAFEYYKQAGEYIDKTDDYEQQASIYANLGTMNAIQGNHSVAITHYKKAIKKFTDNAEDNEKQLCSLYRNLGASHTMINQYDLGLDYFVKSLKVAEKINDPLLRGDCYNNIGIFFQQLEEFNDSLEHLEKAKTYYQKSRSNNHLAMVNMNIGLVLGGLDRNEDGVEHLLIALDLIEQHQIYSKKPTALNNLGVLYRNLEIFDKALECFYNSMNVPTDFIDPQLYSITMNNIGEMLTMKNVREEAIEFFQKSEKLARKLESRGILAQNLLCQAQNYAKINDYETAYHKLHEHIEVIDKIRNAESRKKLESLRKDYEYLKKEKEAEIHRLKNIELARKNEELQIALNKVRVLSGLVPICSNCKKIRDDKGYWNHLETYIAEHSDAQFTHGLCPDCISELYPGIDIGEFEE